MDKWLNYVPLTTSKNRVAIHAAIHAAILTETHKEQCREGYSMHVAPVALVDEPSWLQGDRVMGDRDSLQLLCRER